MKKIISFLGSGNYQETKYGFKDSKGENVIVETRFVQEAISSLVEKDAILYIGLTEGEKGSRKTNWESGNKTRFNSKTCKDEIVYEKGLKEVLRGKEIPFKEMSIKDGKNDTEIWANFQTIFDELKDEDEIYVDVTHSFRSIPIIIMAILNYAKFIKNIDVKGIYYGAFEAREEPEYIAPILDLSLFNDITDWTIGAEKFISTGNSRGLVKEINKVLNPLSKKYKGKNEEINMLNNLKSSVIKFSDSLYSVRGLELSRNGSELNKRLNEINSINILGLEPFAKVLDKMRNMVEHYSYSPILDIFYTAELLRDLGLIQQAYTLLSENILTYLIYKGGLEKHVDKVRVRGYVKDRLYEERTGEINKYYKSDEELKEIWRVRDAVGKYCTKELADLFEEIGKYRNDLNHGGYREDSKDKLQKFENKFEYFIRETYKYTNLSDVETKIFEMDSNPNMILLFSHKLTDNQKENAKDEFGINEFVYLPKDLQGKWSSIDPSLDSVDEELNDIKDWISKIGNEGDYILIQGDYGVMYNMVNFSKGQNLVPIYSTSERKAKEIKNSDGTIEITHVFEHVRFRKY